ncbi:hypothetical protein THARTR1_00553 [Trichoderma harzianum]|uniref:Uncharacterized protein n=1 Tax=Trichoderma harzianum TaxID=5544 RepID=A0A2K0URX8_TRIHA|nr:hypothetical protein THARTR1_00553 [Trichoderma harzianum]
MALAPSAPLYADVFGKTGEIGDLVQNFDFSKSANGSNFDGSPDAILVKEVQAWFNNLISDDDVLNSTNIDVEVLAKIVAQISAIFNNFETFFTKDVYREQTLIDIGVLRFPDVDQPYFKVYRIKLAAWSDSSRSLLHQEDINGITGEFKSRIFRPRASVIEHLTSATFQKAAATAATLFDD